VALNESGFQSLNELPNPELDLNTFFAFPATQVSGEAPLPQCLDVAASQRPPRDPALSQRAGVARGALPGVDGSGGRSSNRVRKCGGQNGCCAVCHGRRRVGVGVRAQVQLAQGMAFSAAFEVSPVFGEEGFVEGYCHCVGSLWLRGIWSEKDESKSPVKILIDWLCVALFCFLKLCCCDCKG
jgi:hypothetical protein